MRVLITGGGCEEPLDGVRSLTNSSTGKTAAFLADELSLSGYEVISLTGIRAVHSAVSSELHRFRSFCDLERILYDMLASRSIDMVIHAAAVSDYGIGTITVDGTEHQPGTLLKVGSGHAVSVQLVAHPKLLPQLKSWSQNKDVIVVGFKLTNGAGDDERVQAVNSLFVGGNVDLVVSNDLCEVTAVNHPHRIFCPGAPGTPELVYEGRTKTDMAAFFRRIHI